MNKPKSYRRPLKDDDLFKLKTISPKKQKFIPSPVKKNKYTFKSIIPPSKPSLTPTRKIKPAKELVSLNSMALDKDKASTLRPKTPDRLQKSNDLVNHSNNCQPFNMYYLNNLPLCPECHTLTNLSLFTWQKRPNEFFVCCENCHKKNKCSHSHSHQSLNIFIHTLTSQFSDNVKGNKDKACEFNVSHTATRIKAKIFCIQCQKWLCEDCITFHKKSLKHKTHILTNRQIKNDVFCCSTHDNSLYEFYCSKCQEHGCQLCTDKHMSHLKELTPLKNILLKEKLDIIETSISKAKDYMNLYNKKIYENMNMLLIKQMKSLDKAYKHFEDVNQNIIKYAEILLDNFKTSLPNYYLYDNLIKNTDFQFKEVKLSTYYNFDNFVDLLEHFNKDSLIEPWEHEDSYLLSDIKWKFLDFKAFRGFIFKNIKEFKDCIIRSEEEFKKHLEFFEPSAFTLEEARNIDFTSKDLIVLNGINAKEVRIFLNNKEKYAVFHDEEEFENIRTYCAFEIEKTPKNAQISFFPGQKPRDVLLQPSRDFCKEIQNI